jgi:hypothetical protein
MMDLAFIIRDRREEIGRRWVAALEGTVADDYREVLASPIGIRQVRKLVDDLVAYSEAEEYEIAATLRRIEEEAVNDAARRVALGFALSDLLMALQQLRGAIWDSLADALVVGQLPPPGEMMAQMKVVDMILDHLVRAEVLGATQTDRTAEGGD